MSQKGKAAPEVALWARPAFLNSNHHHNSAPSPVSQIDLPTGGLFFEVERGDGFSAFLRSAHIGDAIQTIFDPAASRRGIISNRDLLAVHRLHSESDLSLVKGFGRILAVLDLDALFEIAEAGFGRRA